MAAKKPQQVKKPEPVQQAEQAAGQTPAGEQASEKTTVQVMRGTKAALDTLKEELGQPDINGVIGVLIEGRNKDLQSTSEEVHLVMTEAKFRWLLAFQTNGDCSRFLKGCVR